MPSFKKKCMSVVSLCGNCRTFEPTILGVPNHFDACARCRITKYCCKECQIADWKAGHKDSCSPGASLSDINSGFATLNKMFSFLSKPETAATAHRLASEFMVISQSRGVLFARFDSHLDAEKALLDGTILSGIMVWKTNDPEVINTPEAAAHMASYDPSKEFVVMFIMDTNYLCISGIINIENPYFDGGPFNGPYTKIIMYDHMIAENLTGEKRRKRLAVFTRNCVKAMGVKKTPSAIKAKSDAFAKDGTKCHDVVQNEGVAFAFAFENKKKAQAFFDETVFPLFATEKRVVMVFPRGIDISDCLDIVECRT